MSAFKPFLLLKLLLSTGVLKLTLAGAYVPFGDERGSSVSKGSLWSAHRAYVASNQSGGTFYNFTPVCTFRYLLYYSLKTFSALQLAEPQLKKQTSYCICNHLESLHGAFVYMLCPFVDTRCLFMVFL